MAEAAVKAQPAAEAEQELTDGFHLIIDALKLNGLTTIYGVPGIPITDFGRMAQAEGIRVLSTNDHVTLMGVVSSSYRMSQVTAVAEAFAPKKVLNFLKVHPEPREESPASVVVEVIRGTSVNHVTPK